MEHVELEDIMYVCNEFLAFLREAGQHSADGPQAILQVRPLLLAHDLMSQSVSASSAADQTVRTCFVLDDVAGPSSLEGRRSNRFSALFHRHA